MLLTVVDLKTLRVYTCYLAKEGADGLLTSSAAGSQREGRVNLTKRLTYTATLSNLASPTMRP